MTMQHIKCHINPCVSCCLSASSQMVIFSWRLCLFKYCAIRIFCSFTVFWGLFFQTGTLTFVSLHSRIIYRTSCNDCKEWLIDTSHSKQATRPTFVWNALFYDPLFLLFQPIVFEVSLLSHVDNFPVSNVL